MATEHETDAPQSLAALLAASMDPGWADADPDGRRWLLVDLEHPGSGASESDVAGLAAWLGAQPVPIIGVGAEEASPLAALMDLIVTSGAELERALDTVGRNPQASAVLVQVLRVTESMAPLAALTVESMAYATLQTGREFAEWLAKRRARLPAEPVAPRDDLVLLSRAGEALEIRLNSPETRNSLSAAMRDALAEAFKLVAVDDSIRRVDVWGNGPCFSAGGELEEFGTLEDAAGAHRIRMLRMPGRYLAPQGQRYHFHLHRACIGAGIELPAFAGRVSATANTFFQLPEVGMGLIPGAGGCVSIPRRIGRQRTAYMALLNKKINAERALQWGLIDAIED